MLNVECVKRIKHLSNLLSILSNKWANPICEHWYVSEDCIICNVPISIFIQKWWTHNASQMVFSIWFNCIWATYKNVVDNTFNLYFEKQKPNTIAESPIHGPLFLFLSAAQNFSVRHYSNEIKVGPDACIICNSRSFDIFWFIRVDSIFFRSTPSCNEACLSNYIFERRSLRSNANCFDIFIEAHFMTHNSDCNIRIKYVG